jgi:hypothetical protein
MRTPMAILKKMARLIFPVSETSQIRKHVHRAKKE